MMMRAVATTDEMSCVLVKNFVKKSIYANVITTASDDIDNKYKNAHLMEMKSPSKAGEYTCFERHLAAECPFKDVKMMDDTKIHLIKHTHRVKKRRRRSTVRCRLFMWHIRSSVKHIIHEPFVVNVVVYTS
jgi:hypothetical protein